jgi:hypothetical protein
MAGTARYDADILAWADQQAAALRSLVGRHDLPNQLDLANIIEEIENLGKSEMRAVECLIGNMLGHLILLWADPEAHAIRGWRGDSTAWRLAPRRQISPSMRTTVAMNELWQDAVTIACAKLQDWDADKALYARAALGGLACPFDVSALCAEEFDIAGAVAKLPPV